jgi:hypothetical protein
MNQQRQNKKAKKKIKVENYKLRHPTYEMRNNDHLAHLRLPTITGVLNV